MDVKQIIDKKAKPLNRCYTLPIGTSQSATFPKADGQRGFGGEPENYGKGVIVGGVEYK